MEYNVSASDILDLQDGVFSNIKAETLEDTLNFVEGIFPNFVFLNISDLLVFSDVLVTGGIRTLILEDAIEFADETAPRVLIGICEDFLFIWDVVDTPVDGSILDTFVLTDEAVGINSFLVNPDVILFTDALTLTFLPNKTVEEFLTLSDRCSCVPVNALSPYLPAVQ